MTEKPLLLQEAIGRVLESVTATGWDEDTAVTLRFAGGVMYLIGYVPGTVYSEQTSDSGYLNIERIDPEAK